MSVDDPSDLPLEKAVEMFVSKRELENSEETIRKFEDTLEQFLSWAEEEEIETVDELTGWHLEQWEMHRKAEGVAPVTLKGNLSDLRQFLKYLGRIDAVDREFYENVRLPNLSVEEESSDVKLASGDAAALLQYFRNDPSEYGTPKHAVLEVVWNTAARLSGVQALDVGDYDPKGGALLFANRPESGLKNDEKSERVVGIPDQVCDVLDTYIKRERWDKRDEHGRQPLFASRQGRASDTTIRSWMYLATQPCLHQDCPHGEEPPTCEYRHRNYASQCPSSRSPHQVRTGSITWQSHWAAAVGLRPKVISERVDASVRTIRRHYDKATELERFARRRRQFTRDLDISEYV